jgi:hypothetical protein
MAAPAQIVLAYKVDTPDVFFKTYTNDLQSLALLNPYLCQRRIPVGWVEVTKPNIKMTGLNPTNNFFPLFCHEPFTTDNGLLATDLL